MRKSRTEACQLTFPPLKLPRELEEPDPFLLRALKLDFGTRSANSNVLSVGDTLEFRILSLLNVLNGLFLLRSM